VVPAEKTFIRSSGMERLRILLRMAAESDKTGAWHKRL
jgi:hypothetical protein